jgi:hypothetical protein
MPLSNYARDQYVSQELSQLTECRAEPVGGLFPASTHWLGNFVLNTLLRVSMPEPRRAVFFALLRRADAAFADYDDAVQALEAFVRSVDGVSSYFRSLRRFEGVVAMVCQFADLVRKDTGVKAFEKGDGSVCDRLRTIYNNGRHCSLGPLPEGHLHVVWITNDGLHTSDCAVTFTELRDVLCDLGQVADRVSSPEPRPTPEGAS